MPTTAKTTYLLAGLATGKQKNTGFTLIEVMLVLVVIGFMVTIIGFNFRSHDPEKQLEQTSARFAGIFEMATDYGMLNNVELGVVLDKKSYQIVGYDGVRWSELPDQTTFARYQLPDGIEAKLSFDDLPIDEQQLFDSQAFIEQQQELKKQRDEEAEQNSNEERKPKELLPQIYILSGGDITPFTLTFRYQEEFNLPEQLSYQVTGLYSLPLAIEGPELEP